MGQVRSSMVKYGQVISVSLQEWDCDGLCTCYQNLSNNMFQGFGMKDDERWVCSHGSNMTESWNREHPTGWVERWHRSDQEDWAAQQHALVLLRTCITQHNAAPVCPRKVGKTSFHTFPYHGWESTVPMKVAIYWCGYSRIFVQTDQSLSAAILQTFLYFLQIHRGVLGVPSTTSPLPSEHCGSWRSCDICGTKIWLTSGDIRWDGWVDPVDPVGPGWGDENGWDATEVAKVNYRCWYITVVLLQMCEYHWISNVMLWQEWEMRRWMNGGFDFWLSNRWLVDAFFWPRPLAARYVFLPGLKSNFEDELTVFPEGTIHSRKEDSCIPTMQH